MRLCDLPEAVQVTISLLCTTVRLQAVLLALDFGSVFFTGFNLHGFSNCTCQALPAVMLCSCPPSCMDERTELQ